MKLTIKTLDQRTFHVEFDDSRTVWDLKAHLCQLPQLGVAPEQQQLIYAGRVLANEDVLKIYNIDERKFLVVMTKKTPAPTNREGAAATTTKAENKADKKESKIKLDKPNDQPGPSVRKTEQQPQQQTKPQPQSQPSTETLTPSKEQQKQKPEQPKPKPAAKTATATPTPTATAPNAPTSQGSSILMDTLDQAPTVQPNESLVTEIMNMGYGEAEVRCALAASFNDPNRAIEYLIEGLPQTMEALPQPSTTPEGFINPLDFLRDDPRFNQMRRIIQHRPELLTTVLAKIGETNPALLAVIREHQEEFVRMLNENAEEPPSDDEYEDDIVEVVLTDEERLAVERLVALGFPREIVLQAYIACEKNEEQTADFLCRHMED